MSISDSVVQCSRLVLICTIQFLLVFPDEMNVLLDLIKLPISCSLKKTKKNTSPVKKVAIFLEETAQLSMIYFLRYGFLRCFLGEIFFNHTYSFKSKFLLFTFLHYSGIVNLNAVQFQLSLFQVFSRSSCL